MREEVYVITYNMCEPQSLMSALLKQSSVLLSSILFYGLSSVCCKFLAKVVKGALRLIGCLTKTQGRQDSVARSEKSLEPGDEKLLVSFPSLFPLLFFWSFTGFFLFFICKFYFTSLSQDWKMAIVSSYNRATRGERQKQRD